MTMKQKGFLQSKWRETVLLGLLVGNVLVWYSVFDRKMSDTMTVSFLDVGQGDAILVETPSGKQVLIDGGKNRQVLSELGKSLPFGDRTLDAVIATHPDADHIGGLIEVMARYDTSLFIEPLVRAESELDEVLETRISAKHVERLQARRGQTIDFGDGAKLVILFPDRDVSSWETNDASIVARLIYDKTSFLLTGDAGIKTENILLSLPKEVLDTDVLKAGHHGSRTSTSLSFAQVASPSYAIISAGKGNSYGHPHQEVLKTLSSVEAEILDTGNLGTIVLESDGKTVKIK